MSHRADRSRTAAVVATALLTLVLASGTPTSASSSSTQYAGQAAAVTKVVRLTHGLGRLTRSDCLLRFAASHAARMARQSRLYHQDIGRVLDRCGLTLAGENVAEGFPSGRETVQAWMRSPGHRANILNRRYRQLAVAASRSPDGRWYVAQVFGRR